MNLFQQIKNIYWSCPWLSDNEKKKVFYWVKGIIKGEKGKQSKENELQNLREFCNQIFQIPTSKDEKYYRSISTTPYDREAGDPKLIAYYLTQFHPIPENDFWWGKGVTEWNNVSHAVPQYIGHYQPRLPGELGFYDLRLKENIIRQVELAKMYGIYAFCFYYYWFDGKRLLERPLNTFVNDKDIDFPFCLCWANESWTNGFFGSSNKIIMKQSETEESYKQFIHDIIPYLKNSKCITINGKKVLQIYKPQNIPKCEEIIQYWRKYCREQGVGELYLIAVWSPSLKENFIEKGFDALSEFQIGPVLPYCKKINSKISFINNPFYGSVYSYESIVKEKLYRKSFAVRKLYRSVAPMWDNSPRKNNFGSVILDGSNPELYKSWLIDIIRGNYLRDDIDDNIIFINAWNEWGEGAYLEPDQKYGYAYLQATRDSIIESRVKK